MRIAMNTKIYKLIAVTACWFLSMGATMAQETKTVSGVVTDAATGQPLAGVIVEAYGNNRFTALTDDKGAYELKVPNYVSSVSMRVEGYQILQKAIGANKADGKLYPASFSPIYNQTTQSYASRSTGNFDNTAQLTIDPLVAQQLGADIHSVTRSGHLGMGSTMFIGGLTKIGRAHV